MSAAKKKPATNPLLPHCDAVTSWFTAFVISTMTTVLLSMSDSRPNAVVSSGYSRLLKVSAIVSRSAWFRPFAGARLSTYRAICPRTTFAVALTVLNEEQSSLAHRLKLRVLPLSGGPVSRIAGGAPGAGCVCGVKPYHRNRSPSRRNAWNCSAGDSGAKDARSAAIGGWIVSPSSRKLELTPGVPAADCGISRYSAESILEALAGKITHPESRIGSIETKESTASDTANPRPAVHAGSGTGSGGDVPSLHAAASSSDDIPIQLTAA